MKRRADEAAALERKRTMRELADGFEAAVGGIVGLVSSSATELQATEQLTSTATETARQSTTVAAAAEEAASNVGTVAARRRNSAPRSRRSAARSRARPGWPSSRSRGRQHRPARRGAPGDLEPRRRHGRVDLIDRRSDESARPQRHHRGGKGRGRGARLRGRGRRGEGTRHADRTGDAGDQRADRRDPGRDRSGRLGDRHDHRPDPGKYNTVAAGIAAAVEEQGAATRRSCATSRRLPPGPGGDEQHRRRGAGLGGYRFGGGPGFGAASELSRQSEHLSTEVGRFLRHRARRLTSLRSPPAAAKDHREHRKRSSGSRITHGSLRSL